MKYITVCLTGADFSVFGNDNSRSSTCFVDLISRPGESLIWGVAFLFLCIYVVIRGAPEGIERVSKFLMPGLFILLTETVVYVMTLDGTAEGFKYMLAADPAKFNGGTVMAALGQVFFPLSVRVGTMATYGSYVSRAENPAKSIDCICVLDSLVVFLSGLAIVPVAYITVGPEAMGMGGGFAFMALPEVLSRLLGGVFFGPAFFLLLFVAALTSAISTLESFIAWLTEEFGFSRLEAALLPMIPMSFLSAGYSLSQGVMDIKLPQFDFTNGIQCLPMNAVVEKFIGNLMISLRVLFFRLFVGWVWGMDNTSREIEVSGCSMVWKRLRAFLVKFLTPVVIVVILYFTVGRGQGLFRRIHSVNHDETVPVLVFPEPALTDCGGLPP